MFHAKGSGGNAAGDEPAGFDLVQLCATFGSDPFVTSFAQVQLVDLI